MVMPTTSVSFRRFAVYPTVIEPRSIAVLEETGRSNLALTKEHGLDYEAILRQTGKKIGQKNKPNTFRSFEDEINKQYSDL